MRLCAHAWMCKRGCVHVHGTGPTGHVGMATAWWWCAGTRRPARLRMHSACTTCVRVPGGRICHVFGNGTRLVQLHSGDGACALVHRAAAAWWWLHSYYRRWLCVITCGAVWRGLHASAEGENEQESPKGNMGHTGRGSCRGTGFALLRVRGGKQLGSRGSHTCQHMG